MKTNKKILVLSVLITVAVCALISAFVCQLAVISGDSMNPTYHNFEFVLVNKTDKTYKSGDVVAVKLSSGRTIIKRLAGLPDDEIQITDGRLYVNSELSAAYENVSFAYEGIASEKIKLSDNEYFVIGDNVNQSRDSRYEDVGIIEYDSIIGKVIPQKEIKL